MSQSESIGAFNVGGADNRAQPAVRDAIARAAQSTGVDFNYLLAQAKLESDLNPAARAKSSSAAGLYQFTQGTWLSTVDRHGAEHGLQWADAAIRGGRVTDPGMHAQIMALRHDPDASALMAAELAKDNRQALIGTLGREPDATELYLAHFLGSDGAGRFLAALQTDPGQSAAALLPKAAAANRPIFYDGATPRSVGDVMELMRGKMSAAMEGGSATGAAFGGSWAMAQNGTGTFPGGPIAQEFHSGANGASGGAPVSMAETLRNTFALHDGGARASAPDFVRAAYGKLQAFGL